MGAYVCTCVRLGVCACVCVCVAHFMFVLSHADAYFPLVLYTAIPQHLQSDLYFGFNNFFLFYLIHTLHPPIFFMYLCFFLLLSLTHVIITSYTGGTLLNLLSKFATCVSDGVDGKGSTDGGVEMNDLYGGARISYIFNEVRMCARLRSIPSSSLSPPNPHF